jgi:hypothetical protein
MAPSLLTLGAVALAYTGTAVAAVAQTYKKTESFNSTNFFDEFDFFTSKYGTGNYNDVDPTSGFVNYRSKQDAHDLGITSIQGTEVYIGVDHGNKITNLDGPGRNSVRLESKTAYNSGLFIASFTHFPKPVCGAWPAYWLLGANWPTDGEVDIYENWNNAAVNIPAIHTTHASTAGACNLVQADQSSVVRTTNCDNYHTDFAIGQYEGTGCSVIEANGPWGSPQGGVYATQWTDENISVWSWPAGQAPADIVSGAPNPSSWGLPHMSVKSSTCDIQKAFRNQKLVLNIDFCGVTAGNQDIWNAQCAGPTGTPTCNAYVAANPDEFNDVYWKISSIDIFQLEAPASTTSTTSTTSSTSTSSSSTSTSTTSTTTSSSTSTTETSTSSTETSTSSTATSTSSTETSTSTETSSTSSFFATGTGGSTTSTSTGPYGNTTSSTTSSFATGPTGTGGSTSSTLTGPYGNTTSTWGSTGYPTGTGGSTSSTATGPYGNSTSSTATDYPTGTGSPSGTGSVDPSTSTTATAPWSNTTTTYPTSAPPATTSSADLTTSTIYTTTVYTVTSCAPTVTDCPAGPHLTTKTIAIGTTVCPVSDHPAGPTGGSGSGSSASLPEGWTTSTVYSTTTYTITSCKPTVTDCPGKIGQVTTEVVPVYTTVCPIEGEGYSFTTQYTTVQATTTKHLPAPVETATSAPAVVDITATVVPSSSVAPVAGSPSSVPAGGVPSYSVPAGNYSTGAYSTKAPVSTSTTTGSVPVVTAGGAKAGVSLALVAVVAALFTL